jgi:mRNA interferase RelE/StbE
VLFCIQMSYSIVYTKQAVKVLIRMPQQTSKAIRLKLEQIAETPFAAHPNVTKLHGREGYRLRQGDWRVIFDIQQEQLVILVLEIALQKEVYR